MHAHWLIFIVNKRTSNEFIIDAMRQRVRAGSLTTFHHNKQIDASSSWVCPVIDNEFRHNIVKVVYKSTQLSPRGSTVTLTMCGSRKYPYPPTEVFFSLSPHPPPPTPDFPLRRASRYSPPPSGISKIFPLGPPTPRKFQIHK